MSAKIDFLDGEPFAFRSSVGIDHSIPTNLNACVVAKTHIYGFIRWTRFQTSQR